MTLIYLIVLWLWRRFKPAAPTRPDAPPIIDFLTEARKTHPEEMEKVDFASWELQMQTEEPWK